MKMKRWRKEDGIALVLAIIMLLVLSILGIFASFTSHIDFKLMSNYKEGEEAFLAAERCVQEVKSKLEIEGVEGVLFDISGGTTTGVEIELPEGSRCRSGDREFNRDAPTESVSLAPPPALLLDIVTQKGTGRPIRGTSLPSGGVGGAAFIPVESTVVGKSSTDRDPEDTDPTINTGIEIDVGIEGIVPGGASNVY